MPRVDGTGPAGIGSMTGRGYCTGFATPGYANQTFGCGMGFGRGVRRMHLAPNWSCRYAGCKPIDEKEALSNQASFLEKELEDIKARLNRMED